MLDSAALVEAMASAPHPRHEPVERLPSAALCRWHTASVGMPSARAIAVADRPGHADILRKQIDGSVGR